MAHLLEKIREIRNEGSTEFNISNGSAYFRDKDLTITDKEVADYVKQHLLIKDMFDVEKVTAAALMSFTILSGSVDMTDMPEEWHFGFDK